MALRAQPLDICGVYLPSCCLSRHASRVVHETIFLELHLNWSFLQLHLNWSFLQLSYSVLIWLQAPKVPQGSAPITHPHALRFLGLLPGDSHRQPIAPPPYTTFDLPTFRLQGVKVVRGVQEDGYVDYEIVSTHCRVRDAVEANRPGMSASSGSGGARDSGGAQFFTYCRFRKFHQLHRALKAVLPGPDTPGGTKSSIHQHTHVTIKFYNIVC